MARHKCFQKEMQFDYKADVWRCADCGRPYRPRQQKVVVLVKRDDWRPWEMKQPDLALPEDGLWKPWLSYVVR